MWKRIITIIMACCLLLASLPGCAVVNKAQTLPEDEEDAAWEKLAAAEYPEAVKKVSSDDYFNNKGIFDDAAYEEDSKAWNEYQKEQFGLTDGLREQLAPFYSSASAFLLNNDGENRVCSPLNIYIALAILAEAAEGETRNEILKVLGAEDMETARDTAVRLWRTNYVDNGELLTDLAASLWLRQGLPVKEDALQRIAESYYADVFCGDPESEAYNKALQDWLNEKTGGLLEEAAEGVQMDPLMILSIASTVYFRGKWQYPFNKDSNKTMTFHGTDGDTEAEFMYKMTDDQYYYYDHFGAVSLEMSGRDRMWLILPDEGYTPEEIAEEEDLMDLLVSGNRDGHMTFTGLKLSVPKFDVTSDTDLGDALKDLGMKKAFDIHSADFTGLIDLDMEKDPVYLNKVQHAARCVIDEEGCTATAFTLEMLCGAAMPSGEVEFTLDRPFLFAITSYTGAVLFTGIVNRMP